MILLKADTTVTIKLGPFKNSSGVPVDSLTMSRANILLSKNGSALTMKHETTDPVHDAIGMYTVALDTTDTNTEGSLNIACYVAGAEVVELDCMVMEADAYSALVAGTDYLQTDVREVIGEFTTAENLRDTYNGTGYNDDAAPSQQQQLNRLAIGTAGISVVVDSVVVTAGTETGTYENTKQANGVFHQIASVLDETDLYYEFDVSGNGVPSSVTILGRSNNHNDNLGVFGYNWANTSWEQIGVIKGQANNKNSENTFTLYATHVGTGANLGKVRVRFFADDLTNGNLYIDQLYVSYAVVAQTVGYALGSIWIDTVNGIAGSVPYYNGVADRPCLLVSDALLLATAIGLSKFQVAAGSEATIEVDSTNFESYGENWKLNLAGFIVSNATFVGASVNGLADASSVSTHFRNCKFETCSLSTCSAEGSALTATITLLSAGTYLFRNCASAVAGTGSPIIDFGAVGAKALNLRNYSGGVTVKNMKDGDTMSLEGNGQVVADSTCTGGVIAIRGCFQKTDNSNGLVTWSEVARYDRTQFLQAVTADDETIVDALTLIRAAMLGTSSNDNKTFMSKDGLTERIVAVLDSITGERTTITTDAT